MMGKAQLHKSVSILALGGILAGGLVLQAMAQTASQVTPDTFALPVTRSASGGITLPSVPGLQTPAGAERLFVTPSGLVVTGAMEELADETAAIEARLNGKRVTGADLFAAARDLEAAYAKAGYLLARVTLPPQTIEDGKPLRLVVTDGYVSAVDASSLPDNARKRVEAIMAPLVGQHGLTRGELERRLLLAGDTPGLLLKSTLKAGGEAGATVIVVEGHQDNVTVTAGFDNSLGKSMGTYTFNTGINLNNMLGLGEVFFLNVAGYPGFAGQSIFNSDPRNRQIAAGITMPLGTDGWWASAEAIDSRTHPTSTVGFTTRDHYQKFDLGIGYSWLRSRNANLSTSVNFDIVSEYQQLDIGGTLSDYTLDRLRVLRITQSGDIITDFGGQFAGSTTLSFGLNAFGARSATAALPLSRTGAKPNFAKLTLSGSYRQGLFNNAAQFSLAAQGQTAFGAALPASEQMGLGGPNWVSAFDSGSFQGDMAAVARAELTFPKVFTPLETYTNIGGLAAPYIFAAAGVAVLNQPSAVETKVTRAAAFGAGLRLSFSQKGTQNASSLTLEYARGGATTSKATNRFNMRFVARF